MDTNEYHDFTSEPVDSAQPEEPIAEEPVNETPEQPEAPWESADPWTAPVQQTHLPYASNSPYQQSAYSAPYSQKPSGNPEKPKAKRGAWKGILAACLALVLVVGSCCITAASVNARWSRQTAQLSEQIENLEKQVKNQNKGQTTVISGNPVVASGEGLTPSQVYAANVGSVVAISNQSTTNIFGQISETASSGSGFIITEDGYIVSNYHVVEGASTLTVMTVDGAEYPAKVVGYDKTNDIALIKVEATGLPAVTVGSSDNLVVGDQVVAIGNPLGELTSTLTVGFVSAKDRTINTDGTMINMMQTDAAINAGNSGGPLFNMRGEVIGITTAKYSGSTSSGATIEGIGFAIPIDDVIGMLDDLRQYGYVTGAYLGVSVVSMDATQANMYNMPMGSYVSSVDEGGAAEKAGVRAKDIITALGEYEVESNSDLTRALRKFKAGDTTTIKVYRSGQTLTLSITLAEKPHNTVETVPTQPGGNGEMPSNGSYEDWYNYFYPFFGGQGGQGGFGFGG